ncbi:hypothetical protein PGT21_003673 [Puccinia graminis f. sp. tritici]|uniref:Uncharacterized protein n=1 Tax=Puccinia graminis f. sp. tritici TaxID=56615 RepID=A0A5B0SGK8_PUCGR|nr:hypothetical protein PGT21_003673 [Puccinia graminis f. sp. tritici]KAA1137148.1 hypothetical protein PGTUg99_004079 [Puccinia graminis f. sp. tritici]
MLVTRNPPTATFSSELIERCQSRKTGSGDALMATGYISTFAHIVTLKAHLSHSICRPV